MQIAYWVLAGVLAVFYLYSGSMKLLRSREKLQPMMHWVDDLPFGAVRAIGVAEILGALGLILPPLLGVLPWLALAAAIGLVVVQIGAVVVHRRRHEAIWLNLALLVAAAVECWLATIWL